MSSPSQSLAQDPPPAPALKKTWRVLLFLGHVDTVLGAGAVLKLVVPPVLIFLGAVLGWVVDAGQRFGTVLLLTAPLTLAVMVIVLIAAAKDWSGHAKLFASAFMLLGAAYASGMLGIGQAPVVILHPPYTVATPFVLGWKLICAYYDMYGTGRFIVSVVTGLVAGGLVRAGREASR